MNFSEKIILVIHGGSGTMSQKKMSPEIEKEYKEVLSDSLKKGQTVLLSGGKSSEAVVEAIKVMENSPLFNAGKGAVFNANAEHELEASIMEGQTLKAGAVSGLKTIKNPIEAANNVMNKSKYVFMIGKGAEDFAKETGCEIVENSYFSTVHRKEQLERAKHLNSQFLDHDLDTNLVPTENKIGTVGAVALDIYGNLAAGTSTGGLTNKHEGRVGDTPLIGAGTYANNNTCAVSCTGHGEYFIRGVTGYDLSCLIEYKNMKLNEAANFVINKKMKEFGGAGGLIAIDREGNFSMPFNTIGMYRGYISKGNPVVDIFKDKIGGNL